MIFHRWEGQRDFESQHEATYSDSTKNDPPPSETGRYLCIIFHIFVSIFTSQILLCCNSDYG